METFLNHKRIKISVFILIVIISLFVLAKFANEAKVFVSGNTVESMNTISVSGEGEVTAVPDIAVLSFSISKEATTTKEAQSLLNESLEKTLNYLKDKSIEDKDVKSEYGGINPKYSYTSSYCYTYPCTKDSKITGYTATQSIEVKIRDIDSANDIRTGLAELGITNISGPTFSIDKEDELKDQARSLAIKNAQEKAKMLAKDLGVKIKTVVSFYESNSGSGTYPVMYEKTMSSVSYARDEAVSLPTGENKITSNVTITYEIK